jgi:hypothetical protein
LIFRTTILHLRAPDAFDEGAPDEGVAWPITATATARSRSEMRRCLVIQRRWQAGVALR